MRVIIIEDASEAIVKLILGSAKSLLSYKQEVRPVKELTDASEHTEVAQHTFALTSEEVNELENKIQLELGQPKPKLHDVYENSMDLVSYYKENYNEVALPLSVAKRVISCIIAEAMLHNIANNINDIIYPSTLITYFNKVGLVKSCFAFKQLPIYDILYVCSNTSIKVDKTKRGWPSYIEDYNNESLVQELQGYLDNVYNQKTLSKVKKNV